MRLDLEGIQRHVYMAYMTDVEYNRTVWCVGTLLAWAMRPLGLRTPGIGAPANPGIRQEA